MKFLFTTLLYLFFATSVAGQEQTPSTMSPSLNVTVMLSDYDRILLYIETPQKNYLKYEGILTYDSSMDIAKAFAQTGAREIHFNSPGGLAFEGYNLGSYFERTGIKVVVEKNNICKSACAFAAVRATNLEIKNDGLYFHTPYPRDISIKSSLLEIKRNNEISLTMFVKYFAEIGFGIDFIDLVVYESGIDTYVVLKTLEDIESFKVDNFSDIAYVEGNYKIVKY